jgi:UDP-N-acetyl-2-amino-2-deoxyglucuronate dehydrogenase
MLGDSPKKAIKQGRPLITEAMSIAFYIVFTLKLYYSLSQTKKRIYHTQISHGVDLSNPPDFLLMINHFKYRKPMTKFKAGVVGIGDVAKEYIKSLNANPLAEVTAVVGRDQEKTKNKISEWDLSCQVLPSLEELLSREDIDIIAITCPHQLHNKTAIAAAKAGKHILCEKPIGMNISELHALKDAVNKASVAFQSGLVLRWNPFIENLKNLADQGHFGNIFYMEADYCHELGPWWNGFSWGGQNKSGGPSASLVAGIHAVDLLRFICGEVQEVQAYGTWGHRKDFGYAPTYVAILKFANGAVGKTSCSFEIESPYDMNFIVHGSKGSIRNNDFFLKGLFPGQSGWQKFNTIMPDSGAVSHHPFKHLVDDFLSALDSNQQPMLNIDEMFKTHELCLALDASIESGKPVSLPLSKKAVIE